MVAPGTTVTVSNTPASTAIPASTGVWFIAAVTERGPVGVPIPLASMADYATKCGARISAGMGYDAADAFFREGGSQVWLSRVVGPSAVAATLTLQDQAGIPQNTLTVTAKGPGAAGNNLKCAVLVTGSTFQLQVTYSGSIVETSTVCAAPADAVAWSKTSNYVTVTDAGSTTAAPNNNPKALSATSLTGGVDDNGSIGDSQFTAALAAFTPGLGPGQVSAPGKTSATVIEALFTHAAANNRVALADGPDTGTAATLTALVTSVQAAVADPSYGTILAPWTTYPAVPTGTAVVPAPRSVPPSALVAGLMARNDGVNDANVAAAGPNGVAKAALDVTQTFSDTDRDTLNSAGVCVIRNITRQGGVQLYGYRSLAVDPNWSDLANVRFRMQLADDGQQIAAGFDFAQIDGGGHVLAALNGALAANLNGYWLKGSLYGATPQDAYAVDTGPSVNTTASIAARQLKAVESVKMSPSAEQVQITIVRYPLTTPII